jgi:hypothetical protein
VSHIGTNAIQLHLGADSVYFVQAPPPQLTRRDDGGVKYHHANLPPPLVQPMQPSPLGRVPCADRRKARPAAATRQPTRLHRPRLRLHLGAAVPHDSARAAHLRALRRSAVAHGGSRRTAAGGWCAAGGGEFAGSVLAVPRDEDPIRAETEVVLGPVENFPQAGGPQHPENSGKGAQKAKT